MRMLTRTTWLVGGRLASDAMALIFYIALARTFGQGGIGDYSFAFAIAAFLGLGVELGLPPLLTRDIARDPSRIQEHFGNVIALQVILAIALGLALLLVGRLAQFDATLMALVLLAFIDAALRSQGRTFAAFLEGVEAMDRSALLEVISRFSMVVAGLSLLLAGAPLTVIMVAHVLGASVYLGLSYKWMVVRFGRPRFRAHPQLMWRTTLAALPFLGGAALYELYARVDIVMLHRWMGSAEAGIYAVAVRLVTTPIVLSFLTGAAMYPALARGAANSDASHRLLFLKTLKWLGILGMMGALLLASIGDRVVLLLFEEAFEESGRIVRWMSIIFLVQFVRTPYWNLLNATNRERTALWLRAVSLIVNISLNILLIPIWGAYGALWASSISETIVLVWLHIATASLMPGRYIGDAWRLLLAGAIGLALGLLLRGFVEWPWAGMASVGAFVVVAVLAGLITRRDVEDLMARHPRDQASDLGSSRSA